mmetsp:Transcript_74889/g.233400  ORF Transcript_74889/g.233400 Transcript_74889/m.233400 type:complete len:206 (-) Transcript_74889:19-636(-)
MLEANASSKAPSLSSNRPAMLRPSPCSARRLPARASRSCWTCVDRWSMSCVRSARYPGAQICSEHRWISSAALLTEASVVSRSCASWCPCSEISLMVSRTKSWIQCSTRPLADGATLSPAASNTTSNPLHMASPPIAEENSGLRRIATLSCESKDCRPVGGAPLALAAGTAAASSARRRSTSGTRADAKVTVSCSSAATRDLAAS